MSGLKPFWRYYGGKFRAAPRYPPPRHSTIVEPFAGAAGYSMRFPDRDVILVEKYPTIAEIWRWLISADPAQVRAIPEVECVDDLPSWVPLGARFLVGFTMNSACSTPRRTLSAGRKKLRAMHRQFEGWTPAQRERVASQVTAIRHWKIIESDFIMAPDVEATWFVDPPYQVAGKHYVHGSKNIDYNALGEWCRSRRGQVIVCEAEGATWLPFTPMPVQKSFGHGGKIKTSREAVWTSCLLDQSVIKR